MLLVSSLKYRGFGVLVNGGFGVMVVFLRGHLQFVGVKGCLIWSKNVVYLLVCYRCAGANVVFVV